MPLNPRTPALYLTAVATSVLLHGVLLGPVLREEPPIVFTPRQPLEATVKAKRLPRHHCATPPPKPCPAS
jgi:hypothetical protein